MKAALLAVLAAVCLPVAAQKGQKIEMQTRLTGRRLGPCNPK